VTERVAIADGEVDTAVVAAFEHDRRELLKRGFALGGAAIAASSIPLLVSVRDAFAKATGDAAILESAITMERITAIAYGAALSGGLLSPAAERAVRGFRGHEQQHARVLVTALTDLGGIPPAPPKGIAVVDDVAQGLDDVKTQADIVNFMIEVETAGIAAYHDALAKLIETRLLQTSASIMANEGQHLVVLRKLVGADPVPNAFETGEK
jgi:rubrerythrin